MIRFVAHVTDGVEVRMVDQLRERLNMFFAPLKLTILNQTGQKVFIAGAEVDTLTNIKSQGFIWTLRFLYAMRPKMEPGDLLIKVDPDIGISGNPIQGVEIPDGSCFGQIKQLTCERPFMGGFQGYTPGAMDEFLKHGRPDSNGAQDVMARELIDQRRINFVPIPLVDLWAMRDNYDANLKVVHYATGRYATGR